MRSSPRNPRFGRSQQKMRGNFRPPNTNEPAHAPGRGGLQSDHDGGPPFPGKKLSKELWTRTRAQLGDKGKIFNWKITFGRDAKKAVDLGCGNGRYFIQSAIERPEFDHLGIELVPPAIRLASLRAGQRGLTNCKYAWGDATEFIIERCEPSSLDEVHLYHPQPYYDQNKIERRQLSPEVLLAIHRSLKPGGLFIFQTDNLSYWEYAKKVAPVLFTWREIEGPWPDAPAGRTLRELVARSQGLQIFRGTGEKLAISDADAATLAGALPPATFSAYRDL
ncbi:MAG: tRNA (guanine(46)-N(7))-methyltransferase TrmB [Planctomycetota bacterium]